MKIYSAERDIQDIIIASAKSSYAVQLQPFTDLDKLASFKNARAGQELYKSISSVNDNDLYITQSVLVSTNWNKNDDVFLPKEAWAARHTPSDKPTNLNHDEGQIVGHITANWAVDSDYNIIPDDTKEEDLPDFFHICNAAVIYLKWDSDELCARAAKLVEEIEAGTKYVSMECKFTDFCYALKKDDEIKYLVRSEETSFLTKKLRIFSGSGEYEGYKIGRVPMNITFSGKGYVDKPANSYSIIFNDLIENMNSAKSGVINNNVNNSIIEEGTKIMSDMYKEKAEALEVELKAIKDSLAKANEKIEAINVEKYENTIAGLNQTIAEMKEGKEKEEKAKKDAEAKAEELQVALKSAKTENEALAKEIAIANQEKSEAKRVSTLVDGGYTKENAVAKVAKFTKLSDEDFDALAEELIAVVKNTNVTETSEATDVLDNVEAGNTDKAAAAAVNTEDETKSVAKEVEDAWTALAGLIESNIKIK